MTDPTNKNPILEAIHDYIMYLAHDWAKNNPGCDFARGMAAGVILSWYCVAMKMKRLKQFNLSYSEIKKANDEYLSLIHEGWGT